MKGKWSILAVIAGIVGVICERMSAKEEEAERMEEINGLKRRLDAIEGKEDEPNGEAGVFGREE